MAIPFPPTGGKESFRPPLAELQVASSQLQTVTRAIGQGLVEATTK